MSSPSSTVDEDLRHFSTLHCQRFLLLYATQQLAEARSLSRFGRFVALCLCETLRPCSGSQQLKRTASAGWCWKGSSFLPGPPKWKTRGSERESSSRDGS